MIKLMSAKLMQLKILKRKYFYKKIATIPVISLPTIVTFPIHMLSLSSPLLLRIYPNIFAFIPILPMCLSSPNRSIYAVSRHILPCVAPLCKVLHYSKTGVPWHTNNVFIIFSTFLHIFKYTFALCFFPNSSSPFKAIIALSAQC